ncbi:hypothetical protein EDD22DRAFT_843519 [Suillus occidentalis]|nr:hypothetical protein EDD22DRAFT_843519 [Suillus occidentalis]
MERSPPNITDSQHTILLTPESRVFPYLGDSLSSRSSPSPRSSPSSGDCPSLEDSGKGSIGPLRSPKKATGFQPYRTLSTKEERMFANMIGRRTIYDDSSSSSSDSDPSDTNLNIFSRGIRSFNREGVRRVLAYKEAAREHRRARVEASAWEMEEMKQLQQVIEYIGDTERDKWEIAANEAEVFKHLLIDYDERQASENVACLSVICPKEQSELDVIDDELDELQLHAIRTNLPIITDDTGTGVVADKSDDLQADKDISLDT